MKFTVPFSDDKKPLSHEETMKLIKKSQMGSTESKDTLVEYHYKLVLRSVQRFSLKSTTFDDLFQVGLIGLIKSIDQFDFTRNVRFSTYAIPTILGEIKRYLRDKNQDIRISRLIKDNAKKIRDFIEEATQTLQREVLFSDLIQGLPELSREEICLALGTEFDVLSMSAQSVYADDEASVSFEDKLTDQKNAIEHWMVSDQIKELLNQLNPSEKIIIEWRYFKEKTQQEIGEKLGISQAHVSRMEKATLLKLKKLI
jgi:RNA polymerase sporulation-specific sigma factor